MLLEERVQALELNPSQAPSQIIYNFFRTQVQLEKGHLTDSEFTQADKFVVLERLESWYTSKGIQFPNQQWLTREREKLYQ